MNIRKIIKEEIDNFDWVNEIETPLSWLIDNFGDLKPIVNYGKIWKVLVTRFGINTNEVREVLTTWLGEVYGITGRTPYVSHHL